jgi:enterochelin esterase-like enzyme
VKKSAAVLLLLSGSAFAAGTLTENQRITSVALGYDLQYRVYLPDGLEAASDMPVLYVTDGQAYISQGRMPDVLDKLIDAARIDPLLVVFVDPRDPDSLQNNRRNAEFFCNRDYLAFYTDELLPRVEADYPVSSSRERRGILGLSFGGLNSACFGLLGHEWFSAIGMHSPANHPVPSLLPDYEQAPTLPLRIFLSYGKPHDNTEANRRFRNLLREKGYEMKSKVRREGHNWNNWRPLIDDVLLYFYASGSD